MRPVTIAMRPIPALAAVVGLFLGTGAGPIPATAQPVIRLAAIVATGGPSSGPGHGLFATGGVPVSGSTGTVSAGLVVAAARSGLTGTGNEADNDPGIPSEFRLGPNYPNPFNPVTTVTVDLPASGPVRIEVFDALGRLRRVAVNETLEAGRHDLSLEAGDLPSGVYTYRLVAGTFVAARRMVLLK